MVSNNVDVPDKAANAAGGSGLASSSHVRSKGNVTKKNSDTRKEQNRNASRAYRERRKQRLALLGEILDKERGQRPPSSPNKHASEKPTDAPREVSRGVGRRPSDPAQSSPSGNPGYRSAPLVCEDLSFDSPWPAPVHDHLSSYVLLRATAAFGLPASATSLGLPSGSSNHEQALMMPFETPKVPEIRNSPSFEEGQPQTNSSPWPTITRPEASSSSALGQLLQLLDEQPILQENGRSTDFANRNTPSTAASSSSNAAPTPRDESLGPFMEHLMALRAPTVQRVIYVQQNSLFAAVMDNTLAIGCLQGMQMMFSDDGISPFFNKDWTASTSKSKGDSLSSRQQLAQIKSRFATTPKDLQPVDEQITIEHHVYLDVLPFPSFRQRALQALAQDPSLFDEDELCTDLSTNGGLVVWGSLGNDQGMEACRSWDMRSWEPKPWFLRKYWFLVGGWEDEMWKASRWWHAVRNEKIGPPRRVVESL